MAHLLTGSRFVCVYACVLCLFVVTTAAKLSMRCQICVHIQYWNFIAVVLQVQCIGTMRVGDDFLMTPNRVERSRHRLPRPTLRNKHFVNRYCQALHFLLIYKVLFAYHQALWEKEKVSEGKRGGGKVVKYRPQVYDRREWGRGGRSYSSAPSPLEIWR